MTNKGADEAKCPLFNNATLQTVVIVVIDWGQIDLRRDAGFRTSFTLSSSHLTIKNL